MAFSSLIYIILFTIINGRRFKSNRKYPFYRPNYTTTQLIFEPFVQILSDPSIDNEEMFRHLSSSMHSFSSYHNYNQYMEEMNHLTTICQSPSSPWKDIISIDEESKSVNGNPLHRIILTDFDIPSEQKQKILMIFGEHPREFIVSESMIDLVSNMLLAHLSSSDIFDKEYIDLLLSHFELHIIPMLNPDGKQELEESGDYCWRWNSKEHQVDLNRNFDWQFAGKHGSTHKKGTEEWHGEHAFSEPEAKFVHDLLAMNNYSVVLDIHSGTQQLFVPFVDTESRKNHRTRPETEEELRFVKFIQENSDGFYKNSGIAWKFNDYGADGTIMDYVGGVAKVKYSVCAEIYGDPTVDNSIDCFVQFNPNNGKHFEETMNGIRTLYTGTFDYFLTVENRLETRMIGTARLLSHYLLSHAASRQ